MAHRILIVGGGYAGALCANRLARRTRANEAHMVLANARPWFVERIRLHEDVAGVGPARRPLASIVDRDRVALRAGTVESLDLRARRAWFADGAAETFDELVLATGSVARKSGVAGIEHAQACASEEQARALHERLAPAGGGPVVVIGGGLTGIEFASELAERRRDLRVALVTEGEVAGMVSPGARAYVRAVLLRLGVDVREHTRVVGIERDAVTLGSGGALRAQTAIWCGGLEPTTLARDAGLDVDLHGRAVVDSYLRSTSHAFVRVIGDAARVATGGDGVLRMACATAMPQGAFCADDVHASLSGRERRPFSFGYVGQCLSLGRRDGLVQHVDSWDVPRRLYARGRLAAWIKEVVCRYAASSIRRERHGFGYSWPKEPALPPRGQTRMLRASEP